MKRSSISVELRRVLASKLIPPVLRPALAQNHQHRLDRLLQVVGKLVGIPAVLRIPAVRIDAAQHACIRCALQLMVERVPRKRGVIHLDIDLEILIEAVMAQETDHRLGIVIVLVLGRLHRFRLDQEGSFETVFTGVIARHREHHRQMVLLAFHVGIEQRHIPLAAAPKDIILAAERDRCVDCVLDLRAGISHCRKIGIVARRSYNVHY